MSSVNQICNHGLAVSSVMMARTHHHLPRQHHHGTTNSHSALRLLLLLPLLLLPLRPCRQYNQCHFAWCAA